MAYGDSAFASIRGEKSQAGVAPCFASRPKEVIEGRFDLQAPLAWASFRVGRVVRSTLAAEACSVGEAMGHGQFLRALRLRRDEAQGCRDGFRASPAAGRY